LTPAVTILILTWNALPFLPTCLETLFVQDYPHFSVMVLDNDSTDGTPEWVRTHYPAVQVVENVRNLGFAAGNNVGLRQVETPFVVLVNPDVELAPDWLTQLLAPMRQDATIGVAGCKVYEPDGCTLQHAGGYITFPQALPGHHGLGEVDAAHFDAARDVEYVIGAAFALRRDLVEHVGLFDEGYFLYFEDADYCRRVHAANQRVVYVPDARLIHLESTSTRKGSAFYFGHMHAGRWRYLLKHYAPRDLLEQTTPAELAWLASRGHTERLGLQFAYAVTQRQLPFLWQERFGYNDSTYQAEFDAINAILATLRQAVWTPAPGSRR